MPPYDTLQTLNKHSLGSTNTQQQRQTHRQFIVDLAAVGDDLLGDVAQRLDVHLERLDLGVRVVKRLRVLAGHA